MKVTCISTKVQSLPKLYSELIIDSDANKNWEFPLILGKTYVIYGICCDLAGVSYLIVDEEGDDPEIPMWRPAPLFETIDNKISRYWNFYYNKEYPYGSMIFKEFEEDPYYYDKLTDWDSSAIALFQKYKKAMDAEANIAQEVDVLINILSKPLTKDARDNGWYEGSQQEVLSIFQQLKIDFNKQFLIAEDVKYLNLIQTVEVLGVDTGKLFEDLTRVAEYIQNLKAVSK